MKNGTLEGMAILAILIVIVLIAPKGKNNSPTNSPDSSAENSTENSTILSSPRARNISLGTGNASYAYQPYEEYITIDNRGRDPADITNWQLKNGKDKRAYDLGGGLRYFPADTAVIGRAALFVSPTGTNIFQNVILEDSETAIITTGSVGSQLPYKIVNFKENVCSGFLEDLPEYTFTPPLERHCPRPANELGTSALDTECRRFIERMAPCHTPEFNTRDREGEICSNCIDGQPLSTSCMAFIKSHFNYNSCIANHSNDQNFAGRTWRIFLNRGWEMWAQEYETMELFDQFGRLVDDRSY